MYKLGGIPILDINKKIKDIFLNLLSNVYPLAIWYIKSSRNYKNM
jgi:hypothetical protein